MLRKLRPRLTYANVMSTIAVFFALGGVGAYAANEWTGANIVDGSLTGQDVFDNTISGNDITNNSVTGTDVRDGSLTAKDVGESQFVNFVADPNAVLAHSCSAAQISGVNAQGDHLLLTPNHATVPASLTFSAEYDPSTGSAWLKTCNPTNNAMEYSGARFNLLVLAH